MQSLACKDARLHLLSAPLTYANNVWLCDSVESGDKGPIQWTICPRVLQLKGLVRRVVSVLHHEVKGLILWDVGSFFCINIKSKKACGLHLVRAVLHPTKPRP